MTHCLNTLANLIQQYIWLAPVLALLGGLVTSLPHARYPVFRWSLPILADQQKMIQKGVFACPDHGGRVLH